MTLRAGPALLRHLAAWTLTGVAAALWPPLVKVWAAHGLLLLAGIVRDILSLRRLPELRLERRVVESMALGCWTPVELHFSNDAPVALHLEVFDHYPESAELDGLPRRLELPAAPPGAAATAAVTYSVRPRRRGDVAFGRVELYVESPARLWRARRWAGERQRVRVLPNFKPVARYALLALGDRLGQMGIRLLRRRGEGLDFRELREYRHGDSERRIDWKATARRRTLISREYQDEKDQQIVFLLDCGRRMRTLDGDLAHFDHVLNAVLLLTWVAVKQGDAVGFLTFSSQDERWLPPQKGSGAMSAVLGAVYDLETTLEPPDYLEAATRLLARQRRRCLAVFLTNLRDEDASELAPALALVARRNLALVASLRETATREVLALPPAGFDDALLTAATHRYLEARRETHERIRGHGALTLDVEPDQLPISLVNRYLDVKRSGRL